MGNSLREQLLKAGLVDKSKVQQAKKQSRRKNRSKGAEIQRDSVAEAVKRAQTEKAARDRELSRQKNIKQEAKARKGLLLDYVEKNKLNDPKAQEPFNFVQDNAVKRFYVNEKQRSQLSAGKLAIAQVADRYFLVALEVSGKLRELDPGVFIYVAEQEAPSADDPYADYQVPDDLMW
jgi:uncharacterized protein YaiL (DUF2058 family)